MNQWNRLVWVWSVAAVAMMALTGCMSKPGKNPAEESIPEGASISKNERPNIIFLLSDDQRDNTFSAMGHPWIKTPNTDTLIQDGVRFENAYIAEPVCAPSRVSFFTGMHERMHGVGFSSSYALTEEQWDQSYPALLRENGYFTGFIGKFGMEYYTFKGEASQRFDYWRAHDGWAKFFIEDDPDCEIYMDSGREIITPVMGESMVQFLDNVPSDQPFCLSVSFSVPHGSQANSMHTWDEPANKDPRLKDHPVYGSLYRDLAIKISPDTCTNPYQYIPKRLLDQDKGRNKCYGYDYSLETTYEHTIRYYQMITGMDVAIGELLDALKERGLAENTVIIFSSDHGLLMGEYGMGGKGLLYDLTAKFPCFVYDPRLPEKQRGVVRDELVSSLDITSTILDYAGVEQPEVMEGKSLRPLINGTQVGDWRKYIFLESLFTLRDNPFCEGIRMGKWKYIRMYDGVKGYTEKDIDFSNRAPEFEQLFDLEKDPEEKKNMIAEYEGTELLADLRALCGKDADNMNRQRNEYRKNTAISMERVNALKE